MSDIRADEFHVSYSLGVQRRNAALRKGLLWLENAAVFWLIIHFSGSILALLFTDPNDIEAEAPFLRLAWYPSYLMIAGLTVIHFPKFLRTITFNPLLLICVGICVVSYFWSIDPSITMRRSVAIIMTTAFGFVLAARYDWYGLVIRFGCAYAFLAVGSLIFALVIPELGKMQEIHEGAWRGMWLEKNSFGAQMTKGLLVVMCAYAMNPQRVWVWVPIGVLCFFLVIMCTSKTALLATLTMIAGFIFVRIVRRYPILRIPMMYGAVLSMVTFVLLMMFAPNEMFALIGKDATLTGRTDIWDNLIRAGNEHPWLGHGYGTFWVDPLGPSYWVRFNLDWGVPTAHNGWMETWLSIGFLGIIAFALTYLIGLILALDRLSRGGVENYWALLSTILFLILSMSESTILQQNLLDWVIYVATTAKLYSFESAYWRGQPKKPYWQQ